jgi:hypothetical protein
VYLSFVRSGHLWLAVRGLVRWWPLLEQGEQSELLERIRHDIRHGDGSGYEFAMLRNIGLSTSEDLDALAVRVGEHLEAEANGLRHAPVGSFRST